MSLRDDITKKYTQIIVEQQAVSGAGAEGQEDLLYPEGSPKRKKKPAQPTTQAPAPSSSISNFTNTSSNTSAAPQQVQQSPYAGIASDLSQQVMNRNPLGFAATLSNWAGQQNMPQQPQFGQPTTGMMRALNPADARQLQRNALNPSGAYTPVATGLDGKTEIVRQNLANQPSLWQRVKNFFGGNPTYSSGYGNNPQADANTMALQRRNAQMARTGQQPSSPSGVGAEGQLISRAPTQSATSSGTSGLSRDISAERQRMRDMARQVPPGATTTTRNGNTTTTTTTSSGRFVGGKLVGPDGRAVNPADQADVDAANETRKKMQQSGGAAGGAGISGVKTFSGKPSGTSTPVGPVQSRATKAVSSPQARPTGTSQTRPSGRTTTRQPTRQQPSRKPYVRGTGVEGELP